MALLLLITSLYSFAQFDPKFDYSTFIGRLTDRNIQNNILKIKFENNNIKYFRAGDALKFKIPKINNDFCLANIQDVEDHYLTIYTGDLSLCWDKESVFRRGMQIFFQSTTLHERVNQAYEFRQTFLKQKEDFLLQLNSINNFLYTFKEHQIQKAAIYDKKIAKIQQEKQQALDNLLAEKENKIELQKALVKKVRWVKEQIRYYEVHRIEPIIDKWNQDQNIGLPVVSKPPNILKK